MAGSEFERVSVRLSSNNSVLLLLQTTNLNSILLLSDCHTHLSYRTSVCVYVCVCGLMGCYTLRPTVQNLNICDVSVVLLHCG